MVERGGRGGLLSFFEWAIKGGKGVKGLTINLAVLCHFLLFSVICCSTTPDLAMQKKREHRQCRHSLPDLRIINNVYAYLCKPNL